VLSASKFQQLQDLDDPDYACWRIDLDYPAKGNLREALQRICDQAVAAVKGGKVVLILSDRQVAPDRVPVHALLATGAVHHKLIQEGLRCDANIVVETATARNPHEFAVLIGYGATAIYPWLAYECLMDLQRTGEIKGPGCGELMHNYRKGINKGLYKIISKMGISTIASYRGAQLFESVGLHDEVVELCFRGRPGTPAAPSPRAGCSNTSTAARTTPTIPTWYVPCAMR